MTSVAIIGAGIAGAVLAKQLSGIADVTVFEKSRGVGGRLSARRHDESVFNHGAQFFTARSEAFQSCLTSEAVNEVITDWQPKIVTLQADEKPFKRLWYEAHYVASPQMNALVKALLGDLDVQTSVRVGNIKAASKGWTLFSADGDSLGDFDWLISAAPAPQTLELLGSQFAHADALARVQYSPCFALMLSFDSAPKANFDCALLRNSPIEWIARNAARPGRSADHGLVIHSNNAWAAQHLDADEEWISNQLRTALEELTDVRASEANYYSLHRWRYAKVEKAAGSYYLLDDDAQLAACGDWCLGNRVEDAYCSGLTLGQAIRDRLARQ